MTNECHAERFVKIAFYDRFYTCSNKNSDVRNTNDRISTFLFTNFFVNSVFESIIDSRIDFFSEQSNDQRNDIKVDNCTLFFCSKFYFFVFVNDLFRDEFRN